jgi:tetratricopeptide (TPR) repeat protein
MRRFLVLTLAVAACPLLLEAQQRRFDLTAALDAYWEGRHDQAVSAAAATTDLGPLRLRFVQEVPVWIQAHPSDAAGRARAAAAFLVELTGARLESDWGRLADLIEFTCAQILRANGPPTPFERAWHMATHALAGRARARVWLLGEFARLPHQKPVRLPPAKAKQPDASPMHLMHALERFADDPHFQLTRVVAWTWGRDAEPTRNLPVRGDDWLQITRPKAQLEALTALKPLTAVPEVAAEAWVRSGLVFMSVGDHASALHAFQSAEPLTSEIAMKYIALLNAGRALEALSRPEEAMRHYTRALTLVPGAESATVALASLQFMRDERESALSLLDRAFSRPTPQTDPGRMSGYGSFVRWPELKAALRKELR